MSQPGIRPGIPRDARERIIDRFAGGAKSRSRYFVARKLVGEMLWEEDGHPSWGWGLRDGKKHGAGFPATSCAANASTAARTSALRSSTRRCRAGVAPTIVPAARSLRS